MCRIANATSVVIFFLISFGFTAPAAAGPLEDAVVAAHQGDYAAARKLLLPLAEQGDARAQFNLGYMYANGWGVRRDFHEAVEWYRKAADQGLPNAQYNLGIEYANGDGIAQDQVEAVKWYRRAANQGFAAAQFNLGYMYSTGRGVHLDMIAADMFFSLSEAAGMRTAGQFRALIEPEMNDAQKAEALKRAREWEPDPEFRSSQQTENLAQQLLDTDRRELFADSSTWPNSAVGAVTVVQYGRPMSCTGTLVAPKLVLTAAHCLRIEKTWVHPGNVRFLAGLDKGVPAATSVADHYVVSKRYRLSHHILSHLMSLNHVGDDWAVIVLKDALAIKPVPIMSVPREKLRAISDSSSVMQVGYGIERRYSPSLARDCRLKATPDDRIFYFRCLTNFGYSGSPIIADVGGKPAIIGIASAAYQWQLRGAACSAIQFEKTVAKLR